MSSTPPKIIVKDADFYPAKNKECLYCGLSSFAHRHKSGTKPRDFERIYDQAFGSELVGGEEKNVLLCGRLKNK